ncbi:MAG TPA: hypothetical protein VKS21_11740 [Spirochaetota bacterium]|nr:hypothetical protein [Spirochaetota bacterium]
MKKTIAIIIISLVLSSSLSAAYETRMLGNRSRAMGEVRTVLPEIAAMHYNPAVMPLFQKMVFAVNGLTGVLVKGMGTELETMFSASVPLLNNKLALGGGILFSGYGGIDYPGLNRNMLYNETYLNAAAGYKINRLLSLGLGLKVQFWSVGKNIKASRAAGFNITASMFLNNLFQGFDLGLSLQDILPLDISSGQSDYKEKAIPRITIGIARKWQDKYYTGVDMEYALVADAFNLSLGGNIPIIKEMFSASLGCRLENNFKIFVPSVGLAFSKKIFSINYTWQYPLVFAGGSGEHSLGFILKLPSSRQTETAEENHNL